MILAVASGKGGTGKTMLATSLALSITDAQYIDCDVEEPNGDLFLHADIQARRPVGIPVPRINQDRCTLCGRCSEACEFNALAQSKTRVLVFADMCHGCGVCSYVCPEEGAITETERRIGEVETGVVQGRDAHDVLFAQGRLDVGELMATPLIKAVRKTSDPARTVILDAPPGTSCPLVETVRGVDYCLLVTEPTPFGLNDLALAVGVMRLLSLPLGVIINRSDSGDRQVKDYCDREDIPVLMEIPFRRDLAEAYSKGIPFVQVDERYQALFQHMVAKIRQELEP
ncbi:(4Fe-4S)-binding protein [Candidatus Thiomargarita nelsonii]|uniref:(4Fe-4S)-binding protein n=1 Tax=Candidatus Thiomargarita nelsonii TaxID=1003181 RepID=A0A0A6PF92_9GAMM|nr:(4Fe-4S)-binding protein [Candidatus Thiomargarita nelsonii]